ncbi:MAG: LacI family transcriptional regulator, partial [Novosphingobium sp.]|nr:LacI family transcriptional regulator [Novosphingobium sp.]
MDAATRLDANLMVERCDPERDQSRMIQRLIESGGDGFLLPPPLCDDTALLTRLRRAGTHAVLIGPGQAEAHHGVMM